MPVLILARHAKAAPDGPSDFERSLDVKGFAQAVEAGDEIAERWTPDFAVASAARRTVQTGQAVVEAVNGSTGADLTLLRDESLYGGGVEDWMDVIRSIPETSRCAYIVGHQPTVAEVIGHLCPETGVPDAFRPSSLAVFALPSWDVEVGAYPAPVFRTFRGV